MSAWYVMACRSSFRRPLAHTRWASSPAVLLYLLGASLASVPTSAQPAKPAAHAPTCADCHVGAAASYAHAPMRHALEPENDDPVLNAHPRLTVQQGPYTYTVETKDNHSTYTVTDGNDTMTLPLRWIFGQNSQTWVLENDGHLYESMVSYFKRDQALATTPGDQRITPHTVTEAMGRRLSTWEVFECFNCHASGARAGEKLKPEALRPGVDCERCHVGALQHMDDAAHDNFKTIPPKLRPMDARESANFCGQCHRTWDTVIRNHWKGAVDVRFQPYRLESAKCFIGTDRRISCLACHDPHQPVNHDDAYYDSKCQACHAPAKIAAVSSTTAASSTSAVLPLFKVCPVSKDKCVSCHMPKVEQPGGHSVFTDHLIRVVKPGEPYPD